MTPSDVQDLLLIADLGFEVAQWVVLLALVWKVM